MTVRFSDYASFKIVLKNDLVKEVLYPVNWPEEIEVKEFYSQPKKRIALQQHSYAIIQFIIHLQTAHLLSKLQLSSKMT